MGKNGITTLPGDVARRFGDYFIEKVNNIRESIGSRGDNRSDAVMAAISDDTGLLWCSSNMLRVSHRVRRHAIGCSCSV